MATVSRLSALRDGFLPDGLRQTSTQGPARRRAQRFIVLLFVIFVGSVLSSAGQALQGLWSASLGALTGGALAWLGLELVRRGLRFDVLVSVFILLAGGLAASLALAAGRDGVIALFWLGLAPPLALSLAGPRAAFVVLVGACLLMAACLLIMFTVDYRPLLDVHDAVGAHVVGMLGAMLTFYALVRAYERETQADIVELETSNRALASARTRADAASRAKSDFLATMSHEIRTPMNGVLGMTSVMLAEGDLPPRVREGLQTIHQSGSTLMAVLNDILDFSKIESGHLTLERAPVDLRAELSAVAKLLRQVAEDQHDTLTFQVADEVPPWVMGDGVRLRQLAMNLISNALKFTRGGRVEVAASVVDAKLRLEVRDTGIGMTPDVLARLFTPFSQADASTTRRFGGTGLGLAIVRKLAAAMDGTITATSAPDAGSCFVLTLPLVVAAAPAAKATVAPTPARPLRVLVAEDNLVNQRVAVRLLEQLGHRVVVATNGAEALERVDRDADIDAVLMDCHMPVMDGFEATRSLRARARRLPIFALTASSLPEERARCLECGMDAVLTKPVRHAELEALLRGVAAQTSPDFAASVA